MHTTSSIRRCEHHRDLRHEIFRLRSRAVASERIAIVERKTHAPWSPHDIDSVGLAGSQTSFVLLARELSRRGHDVQFFGDVPKTTVDGVRYGPRSEFDLSISWAMVIGARYPRLLPRIPPSSVRVLWAHDAHYRDELDPEVAENIDVVVVASVWHAARIAWRYPYVTEKLVIIPNAIDAAAYEGIGDQRRCRVVYSSDPDRGLDLLLELWPQIREAVPEAEFVFCCPPVYAVRGRENDKFVPLAQRIEQLSDQPGVTNLESIGQHDLRMLLGQSRVWVLPAWSERRHAPWAETFCIGAVEAQAAGCWVVASRVGALDETVKVGQLLDTPMGSKEWRDELCEAIIAGLTSPDVATLAQSQGPVEAKQFDVRRTLSRFVDLLPTS